MGALSMLLIGYIFIFMNCRVVGGSVLQLLLAEQPLLPLHLLRLYSFLLPLELETDDGRGLLLPPPSRSPPAPWPLPAPAPAPAEARPEAGRADGRRADTTNIHTRAEARTCEASACCCVRMSVVLQTVRVGEPEVYPKVWTYAKEGHMLEQQLELERELEAACLPAVSPRRPDPTRPAGPPRGGLGQGNDCQVSEKNLTSTSCEERWLPSQHNLRPNGTLKLNE